MNTVFLIFEGEGTPTWRVSELHASFEETQA